MSAPIPPEDVTTIHGIPVTRPARTLLDLAATESREDAARWLDELLRRGEFSIAFLRYWLGDPRRARHRGARRLLDLLATRDRTDSPLEDEVLRILREEGFPEPELQYAIHDGPHFVARVDLAYPDAKVAIEADGWRPHDRRATFDHERARGNRLESMGWRVLRVTHQHLTEQREEVVAWVRRALAEAR